MTKVTDKDSLQQTCRVAGQTEIRPESGPVKPKWTRGICPNCGFRNAPVDPQEVLWCPACGYSKKGIFT